MITRLVTWIAERGPLALALSIFVALAFPDLAALVRPLLPVSVFCLLAIALTRTDMRVARDHVLRPRTIIFGIVWAMFAVPLIFAACFVVFEPSPPVALGIILLATAPSTVSAPGVCQLLRLDGTFSLAILLLAYLLTPLSVPALTGLILDTELAIGAGELAIRLALLIGGSSVVAAVLRRLLNEQRRQAAEPAFDVLNVALMAMFALAAMDGVTEAFVADTARTFAFIVLGFALNLGQLVVTTGLFWHAAGARRALTLGYSAANRNMALSISALAGHVHPDTWLIFALTQFPIYLTPVLLKPLTVFLVSRHDGAASDREPPSPR